jgi:hypothetical protein
MRGFTSPTGGALLAATKVKFSGLSYMAFSSMALVQPLIPDTMPVNSSRTLAEIIVRLLTSLIIRNILGLP